MRAQGPSIPITRHSVPSPNVSCTPVLEDPLLARMLHVCDQRLSQGVMSTDVTGLKRLLFLDKHARTRALGLLNQDSISSPAQRKALALCILESGTRIEVHDGLAPEVIRLLDDRRWSKEGYWDRVQEDHSRPAEPPFEPITSQAVHDDPCNARLPEAFRGRGLPFFHPGSDYSRANLNGRVDSSGTVHKTFSERHFVCRHLAEAVRDSPNEVLQALSRRDFSQLDIEQLDLAAKSFSPSINFTSQAFGKLLVRLAIEMGPGCTQSHRLGWSAHEEAGHVMRVFLEKSRGEPETITVHLYEPNVTGDTSHLEVYPEDLQDLTFDDFDALGTRRTWDVPVMALAVQDPELAQSCVGAFVPDDRPMQVASVAEALAGNNTAELAFMLDQVRGKCDDLEKDDVSRLTLGLHWSIKSGHASAVEHFLNELGGLGLASHQITRIAIAGDSIYSALYIAASHGGWSTDMVRAYMSGLHRLNMDAGQFSLVVAAVGCEGGDGLSPTIRASNEGAVKEYMKGLQGVPLQPDLLSDIFYFPIGEVLNALGKGDLAVAKAFLDGLRALDVDGEQLFDLFDGRELGQVLQGPPGSITVLMDFLKALRPRLSDSQVVEIVAHQDYPRGTMLFEALVTDKPLAVTEIMRGLSGLRLGAEDMARLTAGRADPSGPVEALARGCHAALQAFTDGLSELGLSAEQFRGLDQRVPEDGI